MNSISTTASSYYGTIPGRYDLSQRQRSGGVEPTEKRLLRPDETQQRPSVERAASEARSVAPQPATAPEGGSPQQGYGDALRKLADQLEQQLTSRRMEDALASSGMPAPPPAPPALLPQQPAADASADQNPVAVDSNQDRQVSAQEVASYQRTQESAAALQSGSGAAVNSGSAVTASNASPEQLLRQTQKLFQAYVAQYYSSGSASGNPVSVTA